MGFRVLFQWTGALHLHIILPTQGQSIFLAQIWEIHRKLHLITTIIILGRRQTLICLIVEELRQNMTLVVEEMR